MSYGNSADVEPGTPRQQFLISFTAGSPGVLRGGFQDGYIRRFVSSAASDYKES